MYLRYRLVESCLTSLRRLMTGNAIELLKGSTTTTRPYCKLYIEKQVADYLSRDAELKKLKRTDLATERAIIISVRFWCLVWGVVRSEECFASALIARLPIKLMMAAWCRKNQEKQIWMNTHQYVRIRPSGLRVLCQFRKFRISMISFIGRVSNIRSDSCWLNILMLKGSIGNYHHLVLTGLVRVVESLLSFGFRSIRHSDSSCQKETNLKISFRAFYIIVLHITRPTYYHSIDR